jgi:hypothetical protein
VWSANVTVLGAWAPGLAYTLDALASIPSARRRMIERGHPWFSLVDLRLEPNERRAVPLHLHIASITGTVWAPEVEAELLACADAIVVYAETVEPRPTPVDAWMAERGDDAIVVYQLDRPYLGDRVELDVATLQRELAIGTRPYVLTNARERQLGTLFRVVVEHLLAARDRLPRRANYSTEP